MLITDRLLIDRERLIKQDQTLSFSGMTWEDYEQLSIEKNRGYRISFYNGVITIMSPSQNHERIKDFIFLLIVTYCDAVELDYYPTGSTTFKDQNRQVGKERQKPASLKGYRSAYRRKTQGNVCQEA